MRLAIVGAGISGLVAAHLLSRRHEVTVFEAQSRIGGHTHTHRIVEGDRELAIDSGFIVFNERNYPLFTRLLQGLGVRWKSSDMGFSVRDDRDGIEYSGRSLDHVFAQRRNLLSLSFHRLVLDILRFYREAPRELAKGGSETLGEFLRRRRFGRRFVEQHILPMGAALWSCSEDQVLAVPVRFVVEFMNNHRMLHLRGRPRWKVIEGGSSRYLEPLVAPFASRIRVAEPVLALSTRDQCVRLRTASGEDVFDRVIVACHSDQALRLLKDPTEEERAVLGAIRYSTNETLLHTDRTTMPRQRKVWSAWNYRIRDDRHRSRVSTVTYHMNTLQGLAAEEEYFVSLNQTRDIAEESILARMIYEHPQADQAGVQARDRFGRISGVRGIHYCGAYWGWGFHEDGVRSGLRAAQQIDPEVDL